jgi:hypothetical protein
MSLLAVISNAVEEVAVQSSAPVNTNTVIIRMGFSPLRAFMEKGRSGPDRGVMEGCGLRVTGPEARHAACCNVAAAMVVKVGNLVVGKGRRALG